MTQLTYSGKAAELLRYFTCTSIPLETFMKPQNLSISFFRNILFPSVVCFFFGILFPFLACAQYICRGWEAQKVFHIFEDEIILIFSRRGITDHHSLFGETFLVPRLSIA